MSDDFKTLDGGKREEYATGMRRDTTDGKPRFDLVDGHLLMAWHEAAVTKRERGRLIGDLQREAVYRAFLAWWLAPEGQTLPAAGEVAFQLGLCEYPGNFLAVSPYLLDRWRKLMERGLVKYGEHNWQKARTPEELARFRESAFRHFVTWFYGLDAVEDHAAAVLFNLGGAEHVRRRTGDKRG